VLYVGKAQKKARVMRTERRRCSRTGATYPWIVESTAMVNHYYFYCMDENFGPLFLKFCSYFPYNAKHCINGHEYLKRQLAKRGVVFQPLDNGIKSCADPEQRLSDELTADKIDRLLRKWLRRLPHPFPARDRAAGYRYQLSILQAEFSLTQVLDQPVTGRIFFEEVIRENLDIGRRAKSVWFSTARSTAAPQAVSVPASLPRVSSPRCMSITRSPGSSSTTRGKPFGPKRRSTTRVTLVSANASKILANCARLALQPTDVCST
jgi:hypothetical protein